MQRRYARRIRCAENAAARSRPSVSEGETYSLGMDVHLLWHVRHAKNLDGSDVHHRDSSGDGLIDGDFDDVKIVGVYSSELCHGRCHRPNQDSTWVCR